MTLVRSMSMAPTDDKTLDRIERDRATDWDSLCDDDKAMLMAEKQAGFDREAYDQAIRTIAEELIKLDPAEVVTRFRNGISDDVYIAIEDLRPGLIEAGCQALKARRKQELKEARMERKAARQSTNRTRE